ncbi:MAG: GxxExxY protein [Prevotella sp.]|nr:GxxExxY protein [Candidatus Prevotella equi]
MTDNQITYQIRGAIYNVYNEFGPGALESLYEAALVVEMTKRGMKVERQKPIDVYYCGEKLDVAYRIDLLVEDKVVVELKSVVEMRDVFHLQILTYMKLAQKHLGILVNFNCSDINQNIWRKIL